VISFLAPLFLAGAAAAAIPVLLHLLRRHPETRVRFAAVRLLTDAPVEHTARRRLRELLLLALRVTAMVLLAVAFARPFVATGALATADRITVIVLDTSLSLSAPGQFERARQQARAALAAASGGLVAVVTFDDPARIAARPALERDAAAAAIDAAAPGFGGTSYRAALSAAGELVQGRQARVIVITDLQQSGWRDGDHVVVPQSAAFEVVDVGPLPPNLAVTAAAVDGDRITASVRNTGDRPRDARVVVAVDGRAGGSASVSVPPQQTAEVVLPLGAGSAAAVSVEDADGIRADNTRYVPLESRARPQVLVVTADGEPGREAFYLNHALTAGGTGGFDVAGVGAAALSSWTAARLSDAAVIALVATRGLDRRGRELIASYVEGGGGVFIAAGPEVDGQVAAELAGGGFGIVASTDGPRAEPRTLAPADVRHPVFQAFGRQAASLGLVVFRQTVSIEAGACAVLARFTSGEPALAECERGQGRIIVLASDVNNAWNNFPRHAGFLPFVRETIRYAAGPRRRPGEYLVGSAPPGVAAEPGIATIPATGQSAARQVAVNIDPMEVEPARLAADDFLAAVTRQNDGAAPAAPPAAREQEEGQRLWQYALGLMLAALIFESFVGTRTA
jgi:hypothetical protein